MGWGGGRIIALGLSSVYYSCGSVLESFISFSCCYVFSSSDDDFFLSFFLGRGGGGGAWRWLFRRNPVATESRDNEDDGDNNK